MSRLHKFDYRIKDNRKRNTLLISICLLTLIVIGIKLYNSYAKFEVVSDSYEMINGKVVEPVNAVEYLTELAKTDDSLVYDGAQYSYTDTETSEEVTIVDNNLRYVGANPNNYVKFNNELWRIIGVMNNVDGGEVSGDGASRVKLIRAESLGSFPYREDCLNENMSYDSENDTYTCIKVINDNNWESSTINEILNNYYYNKGTHPPYNAYIYKNNTYQYGKTASIDFRNNGLNNTSKNLIENAKYYLGGYTIDTGDPNDISLMTATDWYNSERTNQGNNNSLNWTGYIGLMYPSDYGYASNGLVLDNACKTIVLNTWNNNANSNCKNSDWLYLGHNYWGITPGASSKSYAVSLRSSGHVFGYHQTKQAFIIKPVVYLKSTVKIVAGPNSDGSVTKPYKLTI
ncbi:MAG: hypothetical protein IJ574_00715 [Bacilli bacterium]|nr:hypothetical protein [Bacilli bacterium]